MTIVLDKTLRAFIDAEIAAGRYASETELVEEALRAMMETAEVERLRARLAESEAQIARGEYVVADDAYFESKRKMIRDRYLKDA